MLLANPPRPRLPRAVRLLLVAGAMLVAAAVPVAMVALGFHYFTDIVAGTAVGIGTVLLVALLIDLARPAARVPDGTPAEDTRSADRRSFTVTVPARPTTPPKPAGPTTPPSRRPHHPAPQPAAKNSPLARTGRRQHAIEKRWTTMR